MPNVAFRPIRTSTHLPRHNELAPVFFANGADSIVCDSVNDALVMNERAKALFAGLGYDYAEASLWHVNRGRVVGAVAGGMTVPREFIDGEHIGGLEALQQRAQAAKKAA